MGSAQRDAESMLEKHRTLHCVIHHHWACKPTDPQPTFQIGERVCKITQIHKDNPRVWCVVGTGRVSACFTFEPDAGEDQPFEKCIVIAPFSDIETGAIAPRERWTVKYDQSLWRKAPAYRRGHIVPVLANGTVEDHVVQKYNWTNRDPHPGWIYKLGGQSKWITERDLDDDIERALEQLQDPREVVDMAIRGLEPGEVEPTNVMPPTAPNAPKTSDKQTKKAAAAALHETETKEKSLKDQMIKRLNKQLLQQQTARLKEQLANYKLKKQVKKLKQEVKTVEADADKAMAEAEATAKKWRRDTKRKFRALAREGKLEKKSAQSG